MNDITVRNKEFEGLLKELSDLVEEAVKDDNFRDFVFSDAKVKSPQYRREKGYPEDKLYQHAPHWDLLPEDWRDLQGKYDPVGLEYLKYQMDRMALDNCNDETKGFPNKEMFCSLAAYEGYKPQLGKKLRELVNKISYKFLGGHSVALAAFYPPGGYIPWHHNGNAPGYNILLHYSTEGDGSFYSWHDGQVVEYKDKKGEWVVRSGRFMDTIGTRADTPHRQTTPHVGVNEASWHAARTNCWRFTLSTIIDHEDFWLDVIEDIETE